MNKISIVSPVYKARNTIPTLITRIINSVSPICDDYEIILIDDLCPQNSWEVIEEEAKKNNKVKGIKLSRNFGQHRAITAGLDYVTGNWIVVMDCDLQDQPEEINKLLLKAQEGFDIVFAKRVNRKDSFIKKFTSQLFYKVFSFLSGIKHDGTIANFGIFSKKSISAVISMREPFRAFYPMISWVGFKRTAIEVEHSKREDGKSSYSYKKLIELAMEIIIGYSDKLLKSTIKLGFVITFISLIFIAYNLYAYFTGIINQSGFSSLIISIWFLSGLIILILGVLGLYIGKIFEVVKNRPIYIIEKQLNI